jgi:hypothetical protein
MYIVQESCGHTLAAACARELAARQTDAAALPNSSTPPSAPTSARQAERRWASKIIRKEVPADSLPSADEYLAAAAERAAARGAEAACAGPGPGPRGGGFKRGSVLM